MNRTVAVNTRLLLKDRLEGIGRFTYESLFRLCKDHPEINFHFIFDRPYAEEFIFSDNITPIVIGPPARHPLLYYIWFEWALPRLLKRNKYDLFLSPDGYLSLNTDVPSLPVIHDLNFEHFPQYLPKLERWYYRHFFPKFAHKATRIATVSQFSKRDISQTYNISPEKIDVVYNGVDASFAPLTEAEKQVVRNTYTEGEPYLLYVGSLNPRKNLKNLLEAFLSLKEKKHSAFKLLLVGAEMWNNELKTQFKSKNLKDVIFTGRLPDDQLKKVLAAATVLVNVSLYEGFGIPIIEAFRSGVPVLSSNSSGLAEVGGNAALQVNPSSVSSIEEGMARLIYNQALRTSLTCRGEQRAGDFTWESTAARLWGSMEKIFQAGS